MPTNAIKAVVRPSATISQLARQYVDRVRLNPSRRPASTGMGNCCYRYASQKMGCVLMGESTLEYRLLLLLEYDRGVIEYYDQPEPVSVQITRKDGRLTPSRYTADALVLRGDCCILYEAKYVKDCDALCRDRSNDWTHDGSLYHFEPAERAAKAMGASHIVVTDIDLPAILAENLECLLSSRDSLDFSGDRKLSACLDILRDVGESTISSLRSRLSLTTVEPILRWIDAGHISADLKGQRLVIPEEFRVGSRCHTLSVGQAGREVPVVALHDAPRDSGMREAYRRLQILRGELHDSDVSKRSIRRWRVLYEGSDRDILSLVPVVHRRGNRTPRIPEDHERLIKAVICETLKTPIAANATFAYARYLAAHKNAASSKCPGALVESRPVSFPTFLRRIAQQDRVSMASSRSGTRSRRRRRRSSI